MKKAVLFGAGGVGLMAFAYFGSENVECFVDNNPDKSGTLLCGKKIISFEDLQNNYANLPNVQIYLTTDTYFKEQAQQLEQAKIHNYSFFRDYIADSTALNQLLSERCNHEGKICIIGTNNISEMVLEELDSIYKNSREIFFSDFEYDSFNRNTYMDRCVVSQSKLVEILE